VTDVELVEEHPASYAVEASRRHRWIRGDWQLAGWLLPRVPDRPAQRRAHEPAPNCGRRLSRWKMLDNLRRSLVPPSGCSAYWPAAGWLGAGPALVVDRLLAAWRCCWRRRCCRCCDRRWCASPGTRPAAFTQRLTATPRARRRSRTPR
jgi:hypothetical protein